MKLVLWRSAKTMKGKTSVYCNNFVGINTQAYNKHYPVISTDHSYMYVATMRQKLTAADLADSVVK